MNQIGTIVSMIAILACLVLASRNSGIRSLGTGKLLRLLLIWAVILVAVVLIIQVFGSGRSY